LKEICVKLVDHQQRRSFAVMLLALTFGLLSGCGSGIKLGTVTGKVTKQGKPQPNVWLVFAPLEGGRPSHARTDQNGFYDMQYIAQDGVLVGRTRVQIGAGGETDARGNPLSQAKELLTKEVEVQSGANTFDFDLPDH
jgi:hypothetical protein